MALNITRLHTLFIILLLTFTTTQEASAHDVLLGAEKNSPKRESRAVWITTLGGLDWPKNSAFTAAGRERQKNELCRLLDQLKEININTVFLQTRVRASVIYPSKYEPWDIALTGHWNTDPGYDPLQFAIEECHKRGMELHAWVVTIPAYKVSQAKGMGSSGIHVKKPNLVKRVGEQYFMDPSRTETADYLSNICTEIAGRYDIDGIHFDYIRYPEDAGSFPDADAFKKSGAKNKAQWRRNNITRIIRKIYKDVKSIKPWIRMSCSPVGKYRDLSRYPSKGWNCYDAVYQDAQGWLKEGIQDALYPMMYFKGNHFYPFAADWQEQENGRPVAPGLGIYFMSPSEKNWPLSDITNELHYLRAINIGGQAYFRCKFLTDNTKGLYDYLKNTFYAYPALTPAATWLDNVPPTPPSNFRTESLPDGMERLCWDASTDNSDGGVRYNVYVGDESYVNTSKAENLVATALQETSYTYNPRWLKANGLRIVVRAMDRFGNESVVEGEKGQADDDKDFVAGGYFGGPDFSVFSKRYGCIEPEPNGDILLPKRETEMYAITDMQGRILKTGFYLRKVNVSKLPSGWYQLRTLDKKGSRRILEFWKR